MAALLYFNGPPGIGKSTISALYTERHPGTLNLDIDSLHRLVGGWRDEENRTHDVLRPVALAMAATHLAGGRDVVLPQYLATSQEIEAFERVARQQGAKFREIILLDEKAASIARFEHRVDDTDWGEHNRLLVARHGGAAMLSDMYDRLLEIIRLRPAALVVRSEPEAIEQTYAQVLRALRGSERSKGAIG